MKRVVWPELNLDLSALAFGCAPVMGRVSKRQALRAMALAYEQGVTHFDIARAYGFGEAEGVLGEFIADKRSRVTVATKFGILPARMSSAARMLKPIVRVARNHIPGLASAVKRTSGAMLKKGYYSVEQARRSVDDSLKALRIDVIDILFVHECAADDEVNADLAEFLARLKAQGKIRAWGLATHAKDIDPVTRRLGAAPLVAQFPCSDVGLPSLSARQILHSPISATASLKDAQGQLPPALLDWARGKGMDAAGLERALPRLALQAAAFSSPESVILCSMFRSENVLANASALGPDADKALALEFAAQIEALREKEVISQVSL